MSGEETLEPVLDPNRVVTPQDAVADEGTNCSVNSATVKIRIRIRLCSVRLGKVRIKIVFLLFVDLLLKNIFFCNFLSVDHIRFFFRYKNKMSDFTYNFAIFKAAERRTGLLEG